MKLQIQKESAVILLFVLAFVFIFANLGSVGLWEDEAETALVAKTIWTYGIPKISDGLNYFYQEQGKRVGYGDVWAWTPWLQFYVVAGVTKLLGAGEFALRLPFAIAGFMSVILFYRISRQLFNRETALLALLLLIFCAPFLLYVRQCRYYAFVIFGTLWAVNALVGIKENNYRLSYLSLFCALFVIFHANYITWFAALFSVFIFIFLPRMSGIQKPVFITLVLSFVTNLPWFLLFKPLHEKTRDFDLEIIIESIIFYFENLNHYIVPLVLFLFIPILLWLFRNKKGGWELSQEQKVWSAFFVILISSVFFFALWGPAKVFRYLIPAIPFLILLLSILLAKLWQRSRILIYLLIPILIFSNFLNIFFYQPLSDIAPSFKRHLKGKLGSPMISYLRELTHPPQGTVKTIAHYLNRHAGEKDLVIATYGDLPLMFYTELRVIGGLSFKALDEARNANWVITRKVLVSDQDARVMVYLIDNLPWERYERIDLGGTDFPWDNIPEPSAHQFKTLDFNPEWQIQIYRKLKPNEPDRSPDPPSLFYFTSMETPIRGTSQLKPALAHYLIWLKERSEAIGIK